MRVLRKVEKKSGRKEERQTDILRKEKDSCAIDFGVATTLSHWQ